MLKRTRTESRVTDDVRRNVVSTFSCHFIKSSRAARKRVVLEPTGPYRTGAWDQQDCLGMHAWNICWNRVVKTVIKCSIEEAADRGPAWEEVWQHHLVS